jgi:hypothetical protein
MAGSGRTLIGGGRWMAGVGQTAGGGGQSMADAGETLAGAGERTADAGQSLAGAGRPGFNETPGGTRQEFRPAEAVETSQVLNDIGSATTGTAGRLPQGNPAARRDG